MTQPLDVRGVDSDRIDGGGRGAWRLAPTAVVVGLVVGALAGLGYGTAQPTSYTATTAISVQPDTAVLAPQNNNAPQQDATSFIQSQLVVLNGDQLAASVQKQLSLAGRPDVSLTQVGQTYVVQVTASAPVSAQAESIATAVATSYTSLRTQSLTAAIDGQAATVATQVKSVQDALATAGAQSPTTVTPTESALQTQYQQLLQTTNTLAVSRSQVATVVTVLSPASVAAAGALSTTTRDALLGALLGAIAALALALLLRRLRPRIRSVGDLTALGVPVLLPVLPTRTRRARRGSTPWRSNAGRLLSARLAGRGAARHAPIIVVGATPGVGTSHVAASLAAGISERGPVLLVLASELIHGSDTRTLRGLSATDVSADLTLDGSFDPIKQAVQCEIPGVWVLPCAGEVAQSAGPLPSSRVALLVDILRRATAAGWLVVVDAPALSDSDLAVDCAAGNGAAVLVVARGISRPADVLSASELFDAQGSRFVGAILNDTPGWWTGRRRGSAPDPSEALQVAFEAPHAEVVERARSPRRRIPVGGRPVTAPSPSGDRVSGDRVPGDRVPAGGVPPRGSTRRP